MCRLYPTSPPRIIPGGFFSACSKLQPQHFSPISLSKNKPSANGQLFLAFYCSGSLAFPANAGILARELSAPALLVPVKMLHELGDSAEVRVAHLLHQCHVVALQDLWGREG